MSDANQKRNLYCRDMTVANIRRGEGADFAEIVFLESARFCRSLMANRAYTEILKRLEEALARGKPLKVYFTSIESEIIEAVE